MEMMSFTTRLMNSRRRRGYSRLSPKHKRSLKVARLGADQKKRSWRVRLASPVRLWCKLKNGYMNMMLRIAAKAGSSNAIDGNFGSKRIPKARDVPMDQYSRTEFENRLVFEIYKSMVASFELGYTAPKQ